MFCPKCKKEVPCYSTLVAYIGEDLNSKICAVCGFKGTTKEWEKEDNNVTRNYNEE